MANMLRNKNKSLERFKFHHILHGHCFEFASVFMVFHFDRKMSSKCFLIKFRHIFNPIVHLYHIIMSLAMCMHYVW